MYVFGGCTTANTTFNDLWRLDLASRSWIRPLATGTYPPPKACATLVCHEDNLILFGGWTHTSPYPLHQAWRIFSHLHVYNITTNRWTRVITDCPGMAGHSATIHGSTMVVFGGLHCQRGSGGPFTSSNDVWVLEVTSMIWKKQSTTTPRPPPRYGHSQIVIDEMHILVVGGCGGPNMLFNDIWLLTMTDDPNKLWEWKEMEIGQKENGAPHLSFHPACKVSDQVIVLSKSQRSVTSPSSLPQLLRAPSRIWVPPRGEIQDSRQNSRAEDEKCINGKKGVLKRQSTASSTSSSDEEECQYRTAAKKVANNSIPQKVNNSESNSRSDDLQLNNKTDRTTQLKSITDMLSLPSSSSSPPPNSLPTHSESSSSKKSIISIRPNARRNRQRQLEGLDRMEQRLRNLCASKNMQRCDEAISNFRRSSKLVSSSSVRNPMCIYVLDISSACTVGKVHWQPLQQVTSYGPEEIILYSLVLGRGEIIMFGGIQKYLSSRQQEGECLPEVVSNAIYFLCATKSII